MAIAKRALPMLLLLSRPVFAHSTGQNSVNCNGCHGGGATPTVSISAASMCLLPGTNTTVEVTITDSNGAGGGFNLAIMSGGGSLATGGPNSAQTQPDGSGGITQTARKAASGGLVRFSAVWNAPSTPTAATLLTYGLAVNGDGTAAGDKGSSATLMLAVDNPPSCGARVCGSSLPNLCGQTISCGTCMPLDQCHVAGSCDATSGTCSNPSAADGTPCTGGACFGGVCLPPDAAIPDAAIPDAPIIDAPPPPDAEAIDAALPDASLAIDAAPADASASVDAPRIDAPAPDASSGASTDAGGCGCSTTGTAAQLSPLALGMLLLIARRRRR